MRGYVYILSNPAFPHLLKVGRTAGSPESRVQQLNSTGVPSPFLIEASFLVNNPDQVEQAAHAALEDCRHAKNREFFEISLAKALAHMLPLVVQDLSSKSSSSVTQSALSHGLSPGEVSVLQVLFTLGATSGLKVHQIQDYCGGDNLDVNIALANLFSAKLVSRRGLRDSLGPSWTPSPKGIKLLSDFKLVDEWMRKNSVA